MDFVEILKNNNLKVTECRLAILEIIRDSEMPISVREIYKNILDKTLEIEYSTVYRTINIFVTHDIVSKIDKKDGKYYYKLKTGKKHTHMLECEICHKETEVRCPMDELTEKVYEETGFYIDCKNSSLKGICESCKRNTQGKLNRKEE